jgi:8-oxo-dGTP diphosphatase
MKTGKRRSDAGERPTTESNEEEERFLEQYRPGVYPRPSVTVDLVVFTVIDKLLHVLFVRRGEHPFKGRWALPGGFVRVSDDRKDQGEDLAPRFSERVGRAALSRQVHRRSSCLRLL